MEKDIEELKEKIQSFMEKYNCTLEVDTSIIYPRVEIIIRS